MARLASRKWLGLTGSQTRRDAAERCRTRSYAIDPISALRNLDVRLGGAPRQEIAIRVPGPPSWRGGCATARRRVACRARVRRTSRASPKTVAPAPRSRNSVRQHRAAGRAARVVWGQAGAETPNSGFESWVPPPQVFPPARLLGFHGRPATGCCHCSGGERRWVAVAKHPPEASGRRGAVSPLAVPRSEGQLDQPRHGHQPPTEEKADAPPLNLVSSDHLLPYPS